MDGGAWKYWEGDYEETPDVEVAPSKGNLFRNRRPSTMPFEYSEVYREDTFFPGALAELQRPFLFRQTRGQALWLYPVQYNPVRKVLRVYHTLLLRLVYDNTPAVNELDMLERPIAKSTVFSQLHRRFFLSTASLPAEERSDSDEPERVLVLAPLAFQQEIEPLIRWKQQSGLEVDVVSVEEIGSNKADAIYSFVRQYYHRRGMTYLLLIGDAEAINPITLPVEGDNRRYSCDNCFGYLSGDDHFPEVLVGRLHAATPQEARLMVKRILLYEKTPLLDPQADWFSTGMAAASDEGAGYGDDGQADWEHANEWKAKHLADGYTWYWEFYDGSKGPYSPTPNHPSADKDGEPLPYDLAKAIGQRGVSLFNYTGHGWEQGLSTGNFNNQVVRQLKNPGRYPILIAVGCSPGDFTGDVECFRRSMATRRRLRCRRTLRRYCRLLFQCVAELGSAHGGTGRHEPIPDRRRRNNPVPYRRGHGCLRVCLYDSRLRRRWRRNGGLLECLCRPLYRAAHPFSSAHNSTPCRYP